VAPIPNAEAARKLAQPLADYVRNNRKKYDHARVATWQAFAGLVPDGIYGPKTAKALRAFGAKSVVG
jgi:murein L,D-transpeptidase YcbB/YkuD